MEAILINFSDLTKESQESCRAAFRSNDVIPVIEVKKGKHGFKTNYGKDKDRYKIK